MIVLVSGSRSWADKNVIGERLAKLPRNTVIFHGGAAGADLIAHAACRELGLQVVCFSADWPTHGRKAGIMRNLEMLDRGPDLIIVFWDGESRGSNHVINEGRRRGIPLEVQLAEAEQE